MADAPQYRRGSGADALPQGGATALNKAAPAPAPAPAGPEPDKGNPADHMPVAHANPLFDKTWFPDQPVTHGGPASKLVMPSNMDQIMPALRAAAMDPNASPELKNLYTLLAFHAS